MRGGFDSLQFPPPKNAQRFRRELKAERRRLPFRKPPSFRDRPRPARGVSRPMPCLCSCRLCRTGSRRCRAVRTAFADASVAARSDALRTEQFAIAPVALAVAVTVRVGAASALVRIGRTVPIIVFTFCVIKERHIVSSVFDLPFAGVVSVCGPHVNMRFRSKKMKHLL